MGRYPHPIFFCFHNKIKTLCTSLVSFITRFVIKKNLKILRHRSAWMFMSTILTLVPSASTSQRNSCPLKPTVQSMCPIWCLKSALYHVFQNFIIFIMWVSSSKPWCLTTWLLSRLHWPVHIFTESLLWSFSAPDFLIQYSTSCKMFVN